MTNSLNLAIEIGPVEIVSRPMKNGDFPSEVENP